jgi:hypothetical protein
MASLRNLPAGTQIGGGGSFISIQAGPVMGFDPDAIVTGTLQAGSYTVRIQNLSPAFLGAGAANRPLGRRGRHSPQG